MESIRPLTKCTEFGKKANECDFVNGRERPNEILKAVVLVFTVAASNYLHTAWEKLSSKTFNDVKKKKLDKLLLQYVVGNNSAIQKLAH